MPTTRPKCATRGGGFTLVELLVVIAIIGVLVSILLPALKNARRLARLNQSTANLHNIAIGVETYRSDHKSTVPYMIPMNSNLIPATWSFGGKNTSIWWGTNLGGWYNFPAAKRPLNQYVMHDVVFEFPIDPQNRNPVEAPVFRSPGDIACHQRNFPLPDRSISSYDDCGTSYHYNGRWYDLVPSATQAQWPRYSLRLSQAFGRALDLPVVNAARFVLIHDQAADYVSNDPSVRNWITEFGDQNKSVMSFVDGHVDYLRIVPGAHEGPGYQFRFPQMANILQGIRPTGP
jgi:prepilin-type N-terminal cleavage/methylation domain-containing protein